jgi:hypothetical protein
MAASVPSVQRLEKPAREATMTQFTQLNLNSKLEDNPRSVNEAQIGSKSNSKTNSKQKTAMLVGLLAVGILSGATLLTLNGCSKKEPVKSESVPSTQPITSMTPTSPSTPTISDQQLPQKPVKKVKRSSTVSYVNRTYGVSLRYPRKFSLKTGDDAQLDWPTSGPVQMDFVQPGGVTVAAIELPPNSYPGTDLLSAFLTMSVHRHLSASECEQFAFPKPGSEPKLTENNPGEIKSAEVKPGDLKPVSEVSSAKVKVGELEYNQIEDGMKDSDARYYHFFQDGACYEFVLGMAKTATGTIEELATVNSEDVFQKLEKVLATVKIKGRAVPTEASGQVPAAQNVEPTPVTPLDAAKE